MSSYGKCIGFPINFPQYGKMQQNPWYGESPGNWYSCFSHSMVAFFPSDSHPMPYFSTWEIHGFPHKFPTVRETATKLMVWRKSGKLILITSAIVWLLSAAVAHRYSVNLQNTSGRLLLKENGHSHVIENLLF